MFPHDFFLCRTRGNTRSVGCGRNGRDHVDPSPRDLHQNTCLKKGLSEVDRTTYLTPRGILRSCRSLSNRRLQDDRNQTADLHRGTIVICIDRTVGGASNRHSWIFIGRRRSIVEELKDRSPIEP